VKAKDKWKTSALKLLSNVNKFIDDIKTYDKEHIKGSIIKKVKKAMKSPHWNKDTIKKADNNCIFMFDWVVAMQKFTEVWKKVKPLKDTVAKLAKEQKEKEKQRDKVVARFDIVKATVAKLNKNLQEMADNMAMLKK